MATLEATEKKNAQATEKVNAQATALQQATDEKKTKWLEAHHALIEAFDMNEFSQSSWDVRHGVRQVVADEQLKLVQVIGHFADFHEIRRTSIDIFHTMKSCVAFEFQSIGDFILEAKLEKYEKLFEDRKLMRLHDVLTFDMSDVTSQMKQVPAQRLTEAINTIKNVREYCNGQMQDDVDKAGKTHDQGVDEVSSELNGIIHRLRSQREKFRTLTEHQPGVFAAVKNKVFSFFTKRTKLEGDENPDTAAKSTANPAAKTTADTAANTQPVTVASKPPNTTAHATPPTGTKTPPDTEPNTGESISEEATAAVSKSPKDDPLPATTNPYVEAWKAAAYEENFQWKGLVHSLKDLLTTIQGERQKDDVSKDGIISKDDVTKCLESTGNILAVYLKDIETIDEQLSIIARQPLGLANIR